MALLDAVQRPLTELAESALNRALKLDPSARAALLAQLDSPLGIVVEPPGVALSLARSGDSIRLEVNDAATPPTMVRGTPLALLSLAMGDRAPLEQGRLIIAGEEHRVVELTRILADLDPDLESALAGIMGDVPAHLLGRRLRQALAWTSQAHGALVANLEDYVHEEAGVVPPRNEAEVVFDDIQALRARSDSLESRIDTLAGNTQTGSP